MTETEVLLRHGREGGRWINERPTSEDFSEWFTASMKIDAKLDIADYIGGVVLIPGVDSKAPYVTGFSDHGIPIIERREELSYVPYAKVETRVAYWWDLLAAHPEWVGLVEHVVSPRIPIDQATTQEVESRTDGDTVTQIERSKKTPGALASMVHQLPEGFSVMSVPVKDGYSHFLCATIAVSIFARGEEGGPKGLPLRYGRGTKQVPLLTGRDPYADPNSLMKCETGALGRALGFAGIFVIPGSGVATAEDVLEALAQGQTPTTAGPANLGPDAPPDAPVATGAERAVATEAELRARAGLLYQSLSARYPSRAEEFGAWAKARRISNLSDAQGSVLRGVVRKLERLSDQEETDVPTPTPAAVSDGSDGADGQPG